MFFAIHNQNDNEKIMKVDSFLFKDRVPLMNRALDAYATRMTTSAKNIANVNTVAYKPEKVRFEELFQEQVVSIQGASTSDKHIPAGRNPNPNAELADRKIPGPEIMQSGENDVNIDKEMAEIAQTQIRFQFVSQSVGRHFKQLGAAITGNTNY
jgi:flagellar basal-body rod protein FlgB